MTTRWLHRWLPRPHARLRLVLLAHAGGTAASFRPWAAALPDWVEAAGVELPGHGARRGEEPLADVDVVAAAVAERLAGVDPGALVLFGHSMGALLAFETGRRLRQITGAGPAGLVLSGYDAPWVNRAGRRTLPGPDDPRLLERLVRLGGVPSVVAADPALCELLLPPLRADLDMIGRYTPRPEAPLGCPIRVYRGSRDPLTSEAGAWAWRVEASGFAERIFDGDHFYLHSGPGPVLTALVEDLATMGRPVTAVPVRHCGS